MKPQISPVYADKEDEATGRNIRALFSANLKSFRKLRKFYATPAVGGSSLLVAAVGRAMSSAVNPTEGGQ
jgi:hypothetical protein